MKLLKYALIGVFCLVVVDKWAGLGFIWPETSRKTPDRPRTVPKHHPSVANINVHGLKAAPDDVVAYMEWYRRSWSVEG